MGVLRFFGQRILEGAVIILLVTFMPNIPPDAKFSKSYSVKPALPLTDQLELNDRLDNVQLWHQGKFIGPENFGEYNGELYTSIHGGDIIKFTGNIITPVVKTGKPCKGVHQERLCGRPLGFEFDKNGALYVVDAYYGIFKVDVKTGKKLQLISVDNEIEGVKPKLPNSIALLSNGDFFWTDSSTEFLLQDGIFDLLADGSGRLIYYDSKTKQNKVLLKDLHFANGVVLSSDESFLLVSETARNQIHRYYLKGPKKGTFDIFIDRLPGFPDNLKSDGKDGFLVPLVSPLDARNPHITQSLSRFPLVRKFIARVFGLVELAFKLVDQVYPNEFSERAVHMVGHFSSVHGLVTGRGTVLHVSKDGEILNSLHSLTGRIQGISEAYIFKNELYLGSPFNDFIGRIPLADIGLKHLAKEIVAKKPIEQVSSTTPSPKQVPTTEAPKQVPTTETPKQVPTTETPKQVPTTTQPKQEPPKKQSSTDSVKEAPKTVPSKETPQVKKSAEPQKQASPTKTPPPTQTATPKPATTKDTPTKKTTSKETKTTATPSKEQPTPASPKVKAAPVKESKLNNQQKESVSSKPAQTKQAEPKNNV